MNMTPMNTPSNRREFERNFHITAEIMREGKMHFSAQVNGTIDGLSRVRYLPNGRIDFLSVNEMARLHANMTANIPVEMISQKFEKEKN
ncbi:AVAST type 1 anti-phage system protein Avs1c [Priestia megaterium]|uniref:AVAST type 1 anti-phage system protein Avs1c n=1 Tax=Priestia megaterium TaxID=1404 RepID=UPI00188ED061|nr:AVAST type 1 anti-phage system protein Avs1c [Priestia megaterium]